MCKEALLYDKTDNGLLSCFLCAHKCKIADSKFGFCGVRQNIKGKLYTHVYGELVAANIDPIEKKPLYHFLPGTASYSIATIGCNFKCGFCQNWQISQSSKKGGIESYGEKASPDDIVSSAVHNNCRSISYTYVEPTIFFEYAYETSILAKKAGLYNVFVTNGYMSREALDTLCPYLDAANVDLKGFTDEFYSKNCKAHLQPVIDSITYMKKKNIWVEITTLVIPGENDSEKELDDISRFISNISSDIPWHISRFHPDYKFTDHNATPITILEKAREIGKKNGLHYIYLGNVLEGSDTFCHNCGSLLVKRDYFDIGIQKLKGGKCFNCDTEIKGIWNN